MVKKYGKCVAVCRWEATKYTSGSGTAAASKRWASGNGDQHEDPDNEGIDNDGGGDRDDITSETLETFPSVDRNAMMRKEARKRLPVYDR
jgi:hypothetical protein